MKPNKIWANLAVENLDRTTKFYTQLGFKLNGSSDDLCSFSFAENNFVINFFIKDVLKKNIKNEIANLKDGNEIIFTLGAESREEVDTWQKEVISAGGIILIPAEEFGKGYYGFNFADPDCHIFNVFYM
jgi:predicted lactoylglutathione lyase